MLTIPHCCSPAQIAFLARVTMQTEDAVLADVRGAVARAQDAVWRVGREPFIAQLRVIMEETGLGEPQRPLRLMATSMDAATISRGMVVDQISRILPRS